MKYIEPKIEVFPLSSVSALCTSPTGDTNNITTGNSDPNGDLQGNARVHPF